MFLLFKLFEFEPMESFFNLIFQESHVGMIMGNAFCRGSKKTYHIADANPAMLHIMDTRADVLKNKDLTKVIEKLSNQAAEFLLIVKNQLDKSFNSNSITFKSLQNRWYHLLIHVNNDYHFLCTFYDITSEKQVVEESENFVRLIPDMLCCLDENGYFLKTNDLWEQTTGLHKDAFIGRSFFEFVHPDEFHDSYRKWNEIKDKSAFNTFTNRYKCKNGLYRYFEWRTYFHNNKYYAAARDITRRIEKNQRLENLASFSEELLEMTSDNYDFDKILNNLMVLTPARYCAINLFDPTKNTYTTVAIKGEIKGIERLQKLLGFKLLERSWKYNPMQENYFSSGAFHILKSFNEFPDFIIPRAIRATLSKAFPVGNIGIFKIKTDSEIIGDIVLFTKKGEEISLSIDLDIYIRQIGMLFSRIRTEDALRQSRQQLRQIIDLVPHFIFAKDINGRFILANKSIAETYGTTTEEIIGKTDDNFNNNNEENEHFRKIDREVIISGKPKFIEAEPVTGANNTTKIVQTIKIPFIDAQENIKAVLGVSTDITERVKAQIKLETSEMRYRTLVEFAADTILLGITDGTITQANDQAEKLTGYTKDELTKLRIENLFTSDALNKTPMRYDLVSQGQTVRNERIIRRKDGTKIAIEMNTRMMPDNTIQTIMRDIEETKRIQKELTLAKEKAEENDRLKSAFLSNMSHEIRTPMNAIVGFSGLLADDNLSDEKKQYYIDIIEKNCNNLLRIIDDVLDISKIESGQLEIIKTSCNLHEVIERIKDIITETHEKIKNGIELRFNLPDHQLEIVTDETRLMQVLVNLSTNAMNFTQEGYVEIGVTHSDKEVLFFVKDTGIGIAPELHEKVFERFYRTGQITTGRHGGTGLGLTICRSLIEMMGGKIWLESKPGQGTQVYFTLPYVKAAISDSTTNTMTSPKTDFANYSILVVEDDENSLEYLLTLLKYYGFKKVVAAIDGNSAVEKALSESFDVILMDIQLPDISGLEATQLIKQTKPEMMIIAQTAFAMQNDKARCIRAGCNDYITKPVKPEELMVTLSHSLRKQQP